MGFNASSTQPHVNRVLSQPTDGHTVRELVYSCRTYAFPAGMFDSEDTPQRLQRQVSSRRRVRDLRLHGNVGVTARRRQVDGIARRPRKTFVYLVENSHKNVFKIIY